MSTEENIKPVKNFFAAMGDTQALARASQIDARTWSSSTRAQ